MNGGYVANAGTFLIDVIFGLFIGAVMLRLFLQWARADFYNPLSQAIVKVTNPVLRPLRRYIPAIGRIDTASVVLILSLQILNLWLSLTLAGGMACVRKHVGPCIISQGKRCNASLAPSNRRASSMRQSACG